MSTTICRLRRLWNGKCNLTFDTRRETEKLTMVDIKIQLPDSFFEEEERWGFKITKERKQLWAVELDLLCEFDRVCKKLGLRYFLDGGTLLGAVRDGHFIPWDDDIDVVMLREDYNRLLEYGSAEFKYPIFLQNAYTDVDYRRGLTQLRRTDTTFILKREIEKNLPFNQGICIDIFPLDGLPDANEVELFFVEKQKLRRQISDMTKEAEHDPNAVRKLFGEYERFCSRYSDAEYLDPVMLHRDIQKIQWYKRDFFVQTIKVEFEGFAFSAPVEYDSVLTCLYGADYKIPKRVPTEHGDIIWDADVSYIQTMKNLLL